MRQSSHFSLCRHYEEAAGRRGNPVCVTGSPRHVVPRDDEVHRVPAMTKYTVFASPARAKQSSTSATLYTIPYFHHPLYRHCEEAAGRRGNPVSNQSVTGSPRHVVPRDDVVLISTATTHYSARHWPVPASQHQPAAESARGSVQRFQRQSRYPESGCGKQTDFRWSFAD